MGWDGRGGRGQHEESVSVLAQVASTLGEYSFQHNEVDVWLCSPECHRFQALVEDERYDENDRYIFVKGCDTIRPYKSWPALLVIQASHKLK